MAPETVSEFGSAVKRTGLITALLLLAACELLPLEQIGEQSGSEQGSVPTGKPSKPVPEVAAIPQEPPRGATTTPAPTRESLDPKRLIGLTREQVTALIGPPKSVTDSPPATVWGYQTEGCSLDVMFYMDLGTRMFRALAYEIRPDRGETMAPPECMARIRSARDVR